MAESANLLATYKLVFVSLASLEIDAKRKKVIILLLLVYAFSIGKTEENRQNQVADCFIWERLKSMS